MSIYESRDGFYYQMECDFCEKVVREIEVIPPIDDRTYPKAHDAYCNFPDCFRCPYCGEINSNYDEEPLSIWEKIQTFLRKILK